jgi:predicted lipoprotein with Yx(FWY)xxD motif
MRRIPIPALAIGVLVALGTASSPANATPGRPVVDAARAAKVGLRHTSLGTILVTSSGFTLYRFTRDPRNKDTCVKVSECSSVWPALRTTGRPVAGPGVKASLLSSISLPGGGRQVTYAGHPLYTYAPASERGETAYVGAMQFGGTWDAVGPSGGLVK